MTDAGRIGRACIDFAPGEVVPVYRHPHLFRGTVIRPSASVEDGYFIKKYGTGYWVEVAGDAMYYSIADLRAMERLAAISRGRLVELPISPFLAPGETVEAFLVTGIGERFTADCPAANYLSLDKDQRGGADAG